MKIRSLLIALVMYGICVSASASQFPIPGARSKTASFYGDSITYRSAWNCNGALSGPDCEALKIDASFPTHIPYFFDHPSALIVVDGQGGTTCTPYGSDPGLTARLHDNGEGFVGVLIGINDVNSLNISIPQTVACIESAWSKIYANGAFPVAMTYPPFGGTVWSVSATVAEQRRVALNSAIRQAVNQFYSTYGKRVLLIDFGHAYDPTPGLLTFDGVHPNQYGAEILGGFFP